MKVSVPDNGLYYEFTLIFSKTTIGDVNHLNLAVLLTSGPKERNP